MREDGCIYYSAVNTNDDTSFLHVLLFLGREVMRAGLHAH